MKNTNKLFGIITLVMVIGFSFTACGSGGGNGITGGVGGGHGITGGGDGGNEITGGGDPCVGEHSFTAWTDHSTVVWGMETRACSICSVKANDGSLRLTDSNMVQLSAGTFDSGLYGFTAAFEIASFRMSRYEITQGQWAAVMAGTSNNQSPSQFSSDPENGEIQAQRPVERITWFDALEFANTLSELAGLTPVYTLTNIIRNASGNITAATVPVPENLSNSGYRLPTNTQWVYAAFSVSGKTEGFFSINSYGDVVNDSGATTDRGHLYNHAWYGANSNYMTHQVGLKTANNWGLHDMHGNVSEWTSSVLPENGSYLLLMGGDYRSSAYQMQISPTMGYSLPGNHSVPSVVPFGFRLASP